MILAIMCMYLALGVIFYVRLTATATEIAALPQSGKPPSWRRASRLPQAVMRRIRSLTPRR